MRNPRNMIEARRLADSHATTEDLLAGAEQAWSSGEIASAWQHQEAIAIRAVDHPNERGNHGQARDYGPTDRSIRLRS